MGESYNSFSKAEKQGNEMALALALAGVERFDVFKAWWRE